MKQRLKSIIIGLWHKEPNYVYYLLSFLRGLPYGMVGAVYVLLLFSKGFNPFQITLINMIFLLTNFLCQIPTGALAGSAAAFSAFPKRKELI